MEKDFLIYPETSIISYTDKLINSNEDQLKIAQAIFDGKEEDKDGYCGCPKCGSRNLWHEMIDFDDGYISCGGCTYSISGTDQIWLITRWNFLHRSSFQLKIIF